MIKKRFLSLVIVFFICCGSWGDPSLSHAAAQPQTDNLATLPVTADSQTRLEPSSILPDANLQTKQKPNLENNSELTKDEIFEMMTPYDSSDFLARGVIITPTALTGQGAAGEQIIYEMWVANRGSEADTFDIEMSSDWEATISADMIGPLEPGEHESLVLTVTIPTDGFPGDFDTARVTAISQGDPTKTATATRITYVEWQAFEVSPLEAEAAGIPGQIITYTLSVTNLTDITYSITVTVDSTWEVTAPPIVGPLTPDDSLLYKVAVTIPSDALPGEADTALVTFVQPLPGAMEAVSSLTTRVATDYAFNVLVDEDTLSIDTPPDLTPTFVNFTLNIANTGLITDTYSLAVNSLWDVNYPSLEGPVAPGESSDLITVAFTVSLDVQNGDVHIATVRITSLADPTLYQDIEFTILASWYELYLPMTLKY